MPLPAFARGVEGYTLLLALLSTRPPGPWRRISNSHSASAYFSCRLALRNNIVITTSRCRPVCSQISCTSLCPWQTVRRGTATRNPIYYGLKISDTYEVTWPALERRPWCVGQRRDSSNTAGPGLLLQLVGMWIVSCQILI